MESTAINVVRELSPAFNGAGNQSPVDFTVWHGLDSPAWRVMFESGLNFETTVWTTREGIEALRDACNTALVEDDIARGARPHLEVVT